MTVTTDPHGGVSCIELQPLRSRLSPQIVYLTAACAIALALFAPATPSPLYGIYASRWHLSAAAVTGIFAASALGVLVSLLLARRISDEGGRRPVLLVAIAGISASPILYMLAASAAWLVAARLSQGVATGIAVSTASAALLDLHPRRDPVATGITNGVASAGGSGAGLEELASSYPDVEVLTDPIYVRDRNVYTSAGVTTGSDLTLVLVLVLVLVEEDLGSAVAQRGARALLLFLRRPGGQAQFSNALRTPPAQRPDIRDLQGWITDQIHDRPAHLWPRQSPTPARSRRPGPTPEAAVTSRGCSLAPPPPPPRRTHPRTARRSTMPAPRNTCPDLIRPFAVTLPASAPEELKRRLAATRWPDPETVANWSRGVRSQGRRALTAHWERDYDWRRFEARLNCPPRSLTTIDGLDIHPASATTLDPRQGQQPDPLRRCPEGRTLRRPGATRDPGRGDVPDTDHFGQRRHAHRLRPPDRPPAGRDRLRPRPRPLTQTTTDSHEEDTGFHAVTRRQ